MNAAPASTLESLFLQTEHHPVHYVMNAASRFHDDALEGGLTVLEAVRPRLLAEIHDDEAVLLGRTLSDAIARRFPLIRQAIKGGNADLAREARLSDELPTLVWYFRNRDGSGGSLSLHYAWNEMVAQLVSTLLRMRRHGRQAVSWS